MNAGHGEPEPCTSKPRADGNRVHQAGLIEMAGAAASSAVRKVKERAGRRGRNNCILLAPATVSHPRVASTTKNRSPFSHVLLASRKASNAIRTGKAHR